MRGFIDLVTAPQGYGRWKLKVADDTADCGGGNKAGGIEHAKVHQAFKARPSCRP